MRPVVGADGLALIAWARLRRTILAWDVWCDDHKRRALPASPETILWYVVDLVDHFTVATIDRRLSSIGYYYKQAYHSLPTMIPRSNELWAAYAV